MIEFSEWESGVVNELVTLVFFRMSKSVLLLRFKNSRYSLTDSWPLRIFRMVSNMGFES